MSALSPAMRRIQQEDEDRTRKLRNQWDELYAEWLINRGQAQSSVSDDWADDRSREHSDRENELARLITTTPAVYPWMIMFKLEVLEHYLGFPDDGTSWIDNREVVMLAGIKADLLRFEPQETKE
jgi:hypothetical protein